jgi:hypothetical protein
MKNSTCCSMSLALSVLLLAVALCTANFPHMIGMLIALAVCDYTAL